MSEAGEPQSPLWFERTTRGVGFHPVNWQGRSAMFLYCFLVLVAVITYSQLILTVFVIGFYTVVFTLIVAVKSDLLKDWPHDR
ncbi:MAG: hypothetical protein ABSB09_12510 [Acidimicrobiales bacterium]|jgi:hypothetical protein